MLKTAGATRRPYASAGHDSPVDRLTSYAHGGGCACKIPPGELEAAVAALTGARRSTRPANCWSAWTTATTRRSSGIPGGTTLVSTTDFFTPVVDDPYDWGRIAAANALSDVYAMGGTPLVALNLLCWPRDVLPFAIAAEVLRGGLDVATAAGCHVAGGHSVDDPEPKYGMAVTGLVDAFALMRNDAAAAGRAAVADQAARHRRAQQPAQADRRGVPGRRSRR